MKFFTTFLYTFLAVATLGATNPTDSNDIAAENVTPKDTDLCGGKKSRDAEIFPQLSGKTKGKCCAKNSDGSGGIDVNKGGGENCGYCFSGTCSG